MNQSAHEGGTGAPPAGEEYTAWARRWLGDRPIPQELLRLLAIQNGVLPGGDRLRRMTITVLAPGVDDSLLRALTNALEAGEWEVMKYLLPAVSVDSPVTFGSGLYGYWVHPDERADPPAVVGVDSEGVFFVPNGRTLAEVLAASGLPDGEYAFEEFADLAAELTALGFPVEARDVDELSPSPVTVDPEELAKALFFERPDRS
ncbi:hypothetical protein [Planobispora rosea]|uniref:hypothetical protein n=1 Tax=Planobispora rosea TaxID=35762 RepID=UPI00083B8931|nr:hypothetical protein [Planobispora rosea]